MKKAVRAIINRNNKLLVIKRNKFGEEYYTLPGGHVEMNETTSEAIDREIQEETGLKIDKKRLVFIENAGNLYGVQHVYLCEDPGGEIEMHPDSDEAKINKLGQNTYTPMWLDLDKLPDITFRSENLKKAILNAEKTGYPTTPEHF